MDMNSQIRQNRLTEQWIIYAPDRGDRPNDFEQEGTSGSDDDALSFDPNCPFCPGNEDTLTEIVSEHMNETHSHWQTRVVPNKFPVLTPNDGQHRKQDGLNLSMSGYGHHEVIIEHPHHDIDIADMNDNEITTVIETYHQRYIASTQENKNMLTIIFRNHGERAGTSIKHPHSQMVSTGIVPNHIRWRENVAQHYFDTWGSSLMGDILEQEKRLGKRIVDENDSFICFVPFAAEVPYEMWIVPTQQQASFGSINEKGKVELALLLRDSLKRLQNSHNNPDYNYIIHSASHYKAEEPHLRWFVQIRPRIITPAGFEIGSGMLVNPSLPENDAQVLRDASNT